MRTISENKMGKVVALGRKKDAPQVRITPAADRAIEKFPVKDQDTILEGAEAVRARVGHPKQADKMVNMIWDDHIAISLGVEPTPEALAAWRKEIGVKRPAVA